jgi:hypothetical protein
LISVSFFASAAYTAAIAPVRPGIAIVTGGKSGIGRALAENIGTFPFIDEVLAISRSITDPQDVANSPKISALAADVAGTSEGRNLIISTVELATSKSNSFGSWYMGPVSSTPSSLCWKSLRKRSVVP